MAIYHTLTRTVKENPQTGSIISDTIMDPATLGKGVKMKYIQNINKEA